MKIININSFQLDANTETCNSGHYYFIPVRYCSFSRSCPRSPKARCSIVPPPDEQNWASENTMWMNQCFCVQKYLLFSSNKLRASVLFLLRQCDFYKTNNHLYILELGPSLVWVCSGRDQCNTSLWASECTLRIPVTTNQNVQAKMVLKGVSVFGFDPVCGWNEKITRRFLSSLFPVCRPSVEFTVRR